MELWTVVMCASGESPKLDMMFVCDCISLAHCCCFSSVLYMSFRGNYPFKPTSVRLVMVCFPLLVCVFSFSPLVLYILRPQIHWFQNNYFSTPRFITYSTFKIIKCVCREVSTEFVGKSKTLNLCWKNVSPDFHFHLPCSTFMKKVWWHTDYNTDEQFHWTSFLRKTGLTGYINLWFFLEPESKSI